MVVDVGKNLKEKMQHLFGKKIQKTENKHPPENVPNALGIFSETRERNAGSIPILVVYATTITPFSERFEKLLLRVQP